MVPEVLLGGLAFPESPRWHAGCLWFSEKRAGRVMRMDPSGAATSVVEVPGEPSGLGWLPDGRLLVVSMVERRVLRLDVDGLRVMADLGAVTVGRCNDMVVDARGRAYVGHFGYDLQAGESPAPASLVLVSPDGEVRVAAHDLAFPNGCVITPDGGMLIVAESGANRLTAFSVAADGSLSGRSVFADLGGTVPDGICLDAEGAVWVADPLAGEVLRVREGGKVTLRISAEGAVACELGGDDGRILFICTYPPSASAQSPAPPVGTVATVLVGVPTTEATVRG